MKLSEQISAVESILKGAEQQVLEGRQCFVVSLSRFYEVVEMIQDWPDDNDGPDPKLLAAGWVNAQLSLSPIDERKYFVAAKAAKILDNLWKQK